MLPFLSTFDGITIGHFVWLTDTIARNGIIQLKHLMDDRRTVDERWGRALDKVKSIPNWLKGMIVQFIELIGEANILEDSSAEGERCWGWRGDLAAHKEWALVNKWAYAFLHSLVVNWDRLNKHWGRTNMEKQWAMRFWKIWASNLMTLGKNFLRKILKIALFSGSRARRIGKGFGLCEYCKQSMEFVKHTFFDCPKAAQSWNNTANYPMTTI